VNRASSFLGGLAVIAIAVVFVVNFQPGGGKNQDNGPECAAEVHGQCVKASHFRATYRLTAATLDPKIIERMDLKKRVMDALIERELLLAEAKRLEISVSEEEVTRELASGRVRFSLPVARPTADQRSISGFVFLRDAFLDKKTQKFSPENYKRTVTERTLLSEEEFRDFERLELIAERMRVLAMSRVQVAESEGRDEFRVDFATTTIDYVLLQPAFYIDRAVTYEQAGLDKFAESNKADISKALEERKKELTGECRDVAHIMIELPPHASDEQKAAAKAKLAAAKKAIEGGESFEAAAARVSEDRGSRRHGGALGCMVEGEMKGELEPFSKALFGMNAAGDLSDVIETGKGMHLLKLLSKNSGEAAEKALERRVTRELYTMSEGRRFAADGAKEIQGAVKAGKSLEEAVKAHISKYPSVGGAPSEDAPKKDAPSDLDLYAPKVETSPRFTAGEDPIVQAMPGQNVASIAFRLNKGEMAELPITLQGGGLAVMIVKDKSDASDEAWEKERSSYLAARRTRKQREALIEYVRRLKTEHQAEIKLDPEFNKPKEGAAPSASALPEAPPR